jgi:hypothetical protein
VTKDAKRAVQFPTRKAAETHARLIGWRVGDAQPITIMGFRLWTIADDHGWMLTWPGLTSLVAARQLPDWPTCHCATHAALRTATPPGGAEGGTG